MNRGCPQAGVESPSGQSHSVEWNNISRIVRCKARMKRVFSSPILPLVTGAALRLFFVLKFPAGAGDTVIYDQLATNWLKHAKYAMDIAGQPVSVDIRMPGYPAFLAIVYALTGHTGEAARRAVLLSQAFVDLSSCVLIGALAALLASLCTEKAHARRAFLIGLWLAALCPFTANYAAVPLTEVWAIFLTTLASLFLVAVIASAAGVASLGQWPVTGSNYWLAAALAGFVVGLGTLFRPEAPLLLVTAFLVLAAILPPRREFKRLVLTLALMGFGSAMPLVPWIVRNARTLHEFQPLTPKDATLPGELDPKGFMAWERTWLYRVRDCYLVSWKLNDEEMRLSDMPHNSLAPRLPHLVYAANRARPRLRQRLSSLVHASGRRRGPAHHHPPFLPEYPLRSSRFVGCVSPPLLSRCSFRPPSPHPLHPSAHCLPHHPRNSRTPLRSGLLSRPHRLGRPALPTPSPN